ncbi:MAG: ComEA family DNA-binding protein [Burkholderiales bacterium]
MTKLFVAIASALAFAFASLVALPASAAVNINTATKDELIGLPGIGPAKAQAIVDYRKQNGPFKSVDDLRNVKGIGAKRLDKLRADITVGGAPAKVAAAAPAKPEARPVAASAKGEVRMGDAKPAK